MHNKPHYVKVRKVNLTNRREYRIMYEKNMIEPTLMATIIDFKDSKIKAIVPEAWVARELAWAYQEPRMIRTNGDGLNLAYGLAESLARARESKFSLDTINVNLLFD